MAHGGRPTHGTNHDVAEVHSIELEFADSRGAGQLAAARHESRFDGPSGLLESRAGISTVLGRERAERLLQGREDRALTGDRRLVLAQLLDVRQRGDGREQLRCLFGEIVER